MNNLAAGIAADLVFVFAQFEDGPGFRPKLETRLRGMPSLVERLRLVADQPPYDAHDHRAAARHFKEKMASLRALNLPLTTGWLDG